MLKDPEFITISDEMRARALEHFTPEELELSIALIKGKRLDVGLYEAHLNFEQGLEGPWEPFWRSGMMRQVWNFSKKFTEEQRHYKKDEDVPICPEYGVCDSPEQFSSKFLEELKARPEEFCVYFTRLEKANEDKGGWRWHKWGPYIGEQEPCCEYLYDEPVIEVIYLFHVLMWDPDKKAKW